MKECFFEERGIYYRESEIVHDGCVAILIHGLSGSSSTWVRYEQVLEKKYHVVAVDLRGHGKSRKPSEYSAYEMENIADDIGALIDHLHIRSFIPVAHSFGALIAVALLRKHPEGAAAAILMSPIYGIFNILLTRASRILIRIGAFCARPFSFSTAPRGHTDYSGFGYMGDWDLRRIARDLPNTTFHVYLYCLDHAYARDVDFWWSEIRVPTLIVHGTHDSISPVAKAKKLSHDIPHSTLVLIEGANHILPLNNFEEVCKTLDGYLDTYSARASASDF